MRLSMKQLVPTGLDEYVAEHKAGDLVTGRVIDAAAADGARVELGQGIVATCRNTAGVPSAGESKSEAKADLSSLSSMLQARWKGTGAGSGTTAKPESLRAGQVRSFRIVKLDGDTKSIELEIA